MSCANQATVSRRGDRKTGPEKELRSAYRRHLPTGRACPALRRRSARTDADHTVLLRCISVVSTRVAIDATAHSPGVPAGNDPRGSAPSPYSARRFNDASARTPSLLHHPRIKTNDSPVQQRTAPNCRSSVVAEMRLAAEHPLHESFHRSREALPRGYWL